ncbi:MAG TPA: hypothetical protein VHV77_04400 [Pirellulales bacterium]|jgi:hypothetical protein|nr:hypothetical protein [Pirellulales bacterium]
MIANASSPLDRLQVFFGEANPAEARVYARLPHDATTPNLRLEGRVVGPFCRHSRTLPASIPMRTRAGEGSLLLEATVPDPCFWTSETPMLYRVDMTIIDASAERASSQRWLGIRPLGVRGRQFFFEGRNWVLRGCQRSGDVENDWTQCREQGLACIVSCPNDAILEELSHEGVLIIAQVPSPDELSRLARWPAVGLAILEKSVESESNLRAAGPNILLGHSLTDDTSTDVQPWAHFVIAEVSDVDAFVTRLADCAVPVVACRRAPGATRAASARKDCDRLQRDLAGRGAFAGYATLPPLESST